MKNEIRASAARGLVCFAAALGLVILAASAAAQPQPPEEVITRDTVRVCELAGQGITDSSSLDEVLEALKSQFDGVLAFPPNPARALLKRTEVVRRNSGCVHTEWEFYFVGDPTAVVLPLEVIPLGLGEGLHDVTLYNPGCGCQR